MDDRIVSFVVSFSFFVGRSCRRCCCCCFETRTGRRATPFCCFFLSKKKKKTTEANSLRQEEEERRDVVIYTARLTSTIDRLFFCLFVCLFFQYFHFDRVTDAGRQKKIGRGHFVWPDKRAWPVVVLVAFHWSRPEPVTLCK